MRPTAGNQGDARSRIPYPNPFWGRGISMLLALTTSGLFFARSTDVAALYHEVHALLPALLMWGVASGFIHGTGFVPHFGLWRMLFNPAVGWLLMMPGIVLILAQS